ncbi:SpaA isopeptide-forming pilin-related protein [Enterococcus sp. DIV0756]|uniref:SpaA isopeptide-forming pilin-related protein n=1 Tax=Enterococcus sp. DIV0756 TaxID=2774636 RepID=UPI003F1E9C81
MTKPKQFKRMVPLLLPILLLVGAIAYHGVFKGELLKAFETTPTLVNVKYDEKTIEDTLKIEKEDSVEIELVAKQDGIYKLPYDENYSLYFLNQKKEETSSSIYTEAQYKLEKILDKFSKEVSDSSKKEESEEENYFRVEKETSKGFFILSLKKDQTQRIRIERKSSSEINIDILNALSEEEKQTFLQFKSVEPEPSSTSESEQRTKDSSKKAAAKEEITQPSQATTNSSDTVATEESKPTSSTEATTSKNEQEEVEEKKANKEASSTSTSETKKETTEEKKNETKQSEYKKILDVETKTTKKTLSSLEKEKYTEEDSLVTPLYLGETKESKNSKKAKATSPIIVRDAKISVKTGTSSFDTGNDNPGYDSSPDNNLVRSYDQVAYLVSFSIQSTSTTKKYENIRYRVISNLSNAVTIDGSVPRKNAEIANGEYVEHSSGDGSQYSEGVMESVISDTGQVFVPVIANVFGMDNGDKIKPTFKLEIVEADDISTGETVVFNNIYDASSNPENIKLSVPDTFVSSKPSIDIKLVQGVEKDSSVIGSSDPNFSTYNVGTFTVLKPLVGRDPDDFRGTALPKGDITYTIKQRGTYRKIGSGEDKDLDSTQFIGWSLKGYSIPENDRSTATWTKNGTVNESALDGSILAVPRGKTEEFHMNQPSQDHEKIGVYNSGSVTATDGHLNTQIVNKNYARTVNPYTYTMDGKRMTEECFSSLEMIYSWKRTRTDEVAATDNWESYTISLYVDSINYDGISQGGNSEVKFLKIIEKILGYSSIPAVYRPSNLLVNSVTTYGDQYFCNVTPGYIGNYNTGNAHVFPGEEIIVSCGLGFIQRGKGNNGAQIIHMWDPTGFEYDDTREPFQLDVWKRFSTELTSSYKYGVARNINLTAPYTQKMSNTVNEMAKYNWYTTPAEAKLHGVISAVVCESFYEARGDTDGTIAINTAVPLKVLDSYGDTNPSGNRKAFFATSRLINKDGENIEESLYPNVSRDKTDSEGTAHYEATTFDADGNVINKNMQYLNYVAESIYVDPFHVTTKTKVEKPLYQTNEDIDITVNGNYVGTSSVNYDSALNVTLPKGIHYKAGTAKDTVNNITLPDPTPIQNANGTTTLRWTLSEVDINRGSEIKFSATSDFTQIKFKESGYTDRLKVETVGEMWVSGSPDTKDKSDLSTRTSTDDLILQMVQQVILSKETSKPLIELGNNDPVNSDNSITYKVKMVNESAAAIPNAKLLDILPNNNDKRGTIFNGTYTVEEITVNVPGAKITFSNDSFDPATSDPRTISNSGSWSAYTPGVTPKAQIKDAKSILVSHDSLAVGETIELTIKIQPTGQKAGDLLVNNAAMNSDLNLPVNSQMTWTRVYGRDLSGYVWYDDDYDGLIGTKSDGSPEDSVANIPVKLYRTSQNDVSYKDKLVKESLTGEKFVNDSGDSLIKTDADGKYTFTNLPEGEYIAEFVIEDIVVTKKIVIVTKKKVGNDDTLNSKADPTTFKTDEYNQPVLSELPTECNPDEYIYSVKNVNAGLTRLSKIRLFKYEEGTVIDVNKNGTLEPEEIEASTTNALEGAEFQVYKGKKDDPDTIKDENKIGTPVKTGSDGWLEFASLPPGFYTIVETQAPAGFELLKNPIEVEVPTYNYIAIVHVPDKGHTKLPFTGSTKAMRIILIAAACLLVVGMTGVFLHFRPIKVRGGN